MGRQENASYVPLGASIYFTNDIQRLSHKLSIFKNRPACPVPGHRVRDPDTSTMTASGSVGYIRHRMTDKPKLLKTTLNQNGRQKTTPKFHFPKIPGCFADIARMLMASPHQEPSRV